MTILTDTTADALAAALPLRLQLADLGGDLAARLAGSTLYLDPTATVDDQLLAIADAATFLATGQKPSTARRVRHLRAVPGSAGVGRSGDWFREETAEPSPVRSVTGRNRTLTEVTR